MEASTLNKLMTILKIPKRRGGGLQAKLMLGRRLLLGALTGPWLLGAISLDPWGIEVAEAAQIESSQSATQPVKMLSECIPNAF